MRYPPIRYHGSHIYLENYPFHDSHRHRWKAIITRTGRRSIFTTGNSRDEVLRYARLLVDMLRTFTPFFQKKG